MLYEVITDRLVEIEHDLERGAARQFAHRQDTARERLLQVRPGDLVADLKRDFRLVRQLRRSRVPVAIAEFMRDAFQRLGMGDWRAGERQFRPYFTRPGFGLVTIGDGKRP